MLFFSHSFIWLDFFFAFHNSEGWCLQFNQHLEKTLLVPVATEPKQVLQKTSPETGGRGTPSSSVAGTGDFFKEWNEITPQIHIRKFEEQTAWGQVISDIHRVFWVSVDPVDVRNYSQQGTRPQAICSSNFLMWIWGVISIIFEKTWPITTVLKPGNLNKGI